MFSIPEKVKNHNFWQRHSTGNTVFPNALTFGLRNKEITHGEYILIVHIFSFTGYTENPHESSQVRCAEELGYGRNAINKIMNSLVKKGLLSIQKGKEDELYLYRLNLVAETNLIIKDAKRPIKTTSNDDANDTPPVSKNDTPPVSKRDTPPVSKRDTPPVSKRDTIERTTRTNYIEKTIDTNTVVEAGKPAIDAPVNMDNDIPLKEKPLVKGATNPLWDLYSKGYESRYNAKPIRNASTNAHLAQLIKAYGGDMAYNLVEYYLSYNDPFYLSKCYPLGLLRADAQKLITEMETGKTYKLSDAKKYCLAKSNEDVIEKFLAGASA